MLTDDDVPASAELRCFALVPGCDGGGEAWPGNTGRPALPLDRYMLEFRRLLASGQQQIYIATDPDSGKTRIVQSELADTCHLKLLCVTPSTIDVCGTQESSTRHPPCFYMGDDVRGGVSWREGKIVVVTEGLCFRLYAAQGFHFWDSCCGAN